MVGAEALVRWRAAGGGAVSPGVFIPLAEELGLIGEITTLVLERTLERLGDWRRAGLPPVPFSVNLSALDLQDLHTATRIANRIAAHGLSPRLVELEVTETAFVKDLRTALGILTALKDHGLRVSLDDFGTGYATLSMLQRLPVDVIKIDRSFVQDMLETGSAQEIVRLILCLGRTLGKRIVAEGVETAAQSALLRDIGCDEAQGYFHSRPLPFAQLVAFAREAGVDQGESADVVQHAA